MITWLTTALFPTLSTALSSAICDSMDSSCGNSCALKASLTSETVAPWRRRSEISARAWRGPEVSGTTSGTAFGERERKKLQANRL